MHIPSKLNRYGKPVRSGDWYVWPVSGTRDDQWYQRGERILWKPGMPYAIVKPSGKKIPVGLQTPTRRLLETRPKHTVAPRWGPIIQQDELWAYLEGRGMTALEILEYATADAERPWLAVFPILEDGQLVSWQGRAVDGRTPKYDSGRTKDGWLASHETCWGLDRILPGQPAYLCEGIFDALYFDQGVALLGGDIHKTQITKIIDRLPSHLCLVMDYGEGDNRAEHAMSVSRKWGKAIRRLTDTSIEAILPPHESKDFGERLPLRAVHGIPQ